MKDFEREFLVTEPLPRHTDPFIFTTPQVRQQILDMQKEAFSLLSLSQLPALIVTAPLQTIITSMQLSVKPHKHIYEAVDAKSKELAKLNTSLTVHDKRRMELMIRAGNQRPYSAPVYEGYVAAMRGLAQQGYKAFFKGLFFRSIHQMARYYAFSEFTLLSSQEGELSLLPTLAQMCKIYLLQTMCDVSFNILHMAENRYILQNNLPEFRVFRNGTRVIRKMLLRKEALTGAFFHPFNTFLDIFCRFPLLLSFINGSPRPEAFLIFYCCELVVYPFSTAYKRLICQSSNIPGMIPPRYGSIWHGVRLIYTEQGILGLFRGFGLHQLSTVLRLGILISVKRLMERGLTE